MSFQEEIDQAIKLKRLYFIGDSLPLDWYAAFKQWLPLAEAGDPKAQFNIGRCYNRGDGIDKEISKAVEWYMKAIAQGDPRAHYNMHLRCEEDKDSANSAEWLAKAIELKEPRALDDIEKNLLNEDRVIAQNYLVADDKERARPLYQLLVEKGDIQSELGLIACNVKISIEHTTTRHHFTYTVPVSSAGGYVSGGGTRGSSYLNPTIAFKVQNNNSKAAAVSIWIQKYDYLNPDKKIGESRRLDFPVLGAGEVAEIKEELHQTDKEPVRVYFNG